MALHLIKLCVGCDSVESLVRWQKAHPPVCRTRQTPKRAPECVDGGSLFWVIKGAVLCRQAIVDIRTVDEGKDSRCEIHLDRELVRTLPLPRKAFQGWRYFEPGDAPADLTAGNDGGAPPELALRLRELGAW